MTRRQQVEELTVEELRHLLVEKRRADRKRRLDHFLKTGRVVRIEPQWGVSGFQALNSQGLEENTDEYLTSAPPRRVILDRVLLVIEIIVVIGLGFLVFKGVSILRNLNQEISTALVQPTLTATPLIQAVVLPSGHTPPNAPGGVQPNDAEIPEHLRPLAQTLANLSIPTPSPEQAVRIQISAINVDAPVVQGDGWEQLKKGVGQHIGTANPGQNGNVVVSAHNDVFGEIFRNLDQLEVGDEIVLYTNQRSFVYIVQQTQIVEPTRIEVMNSANDPIITMISCYPYMVNDERIVVTALLSNNN